MGRKYLKYVVKSPIVFGTYMGVFLLIFLIMTNSLQLEVRKSYNAEINGKEIRIISQSEIDLVDYKVYVYEDRNQEVLSFDVASTEYSEGVMCISLCKEQDKISGDVTVEVIAGKTSLFQTIFTKAGAKR